MSAGLMFGQSDDKVGYGTTYFPGTAVQTEAQRVRVAVGQETPQINITMATSRIATISGTAVSSSGRPITRGLLMLTSNIGGANMMSMGTSLKPDGSFLFSNVSPGEYRHPGPIHSLTRTKWSCSAAALPARNRAPFQ